MQAEDGGLGAGRIVLGQISNGLEQPRSERIVEKLRADTSGWRQQAGLGFGTQRRVVLGKELVERQAGACRIDGRLVLDQASQRPAGVGIGGRLGALHGVSRWGETGRYGLVIRLHGSEKCATAFALANV